MNPASSEPLKSIRFEGELLPHWAQLIDLAARLCPTSAETRRWFSRFTNQSGVDDSNTVLAHSSLLLAELQEHRRSVSTELARSHDDSQSSKIFSAWLYALETILLAARNRKTCSWIVEGNDDSGSDDSGGGDITLRRI